MTVETKLAPKARKPARPTLAGPAWMAAAGMAVMLASAPAAALTRPFQPYDDEEAASRADVVQQRRFGKLHEFSLSAGIFPSDALYLGVAGTFRYALHLSDLWAWEIAGGTYSFNISSGAEQRMLKRYGLQFTETERLLGMVESNVMLKPIYGKFSVLNKWIWYAEPYLLAGGAVSRYSASWRVGPSTGGGVRLYIFNWLALHMDARYYMLWSGIPARPTSASDILVGPSTLTNVAYLGAGVSFLVWDRAP